RRSWVLWSRSCCSACSASQLLKLSRRRSSSRQNLGSQLLVRSLVALALPAQVDEDRHLLADDLRIERLDQIVGAAGRVGPVDLLRVVTERGHEDDRDVPAALEVLEVD